MKPPDHRLAKLIALARRAKPPPVKPTRPDDIRFFAQRTMSEWQRRRAASAAPDPWRLWERVGNWSLASATAALVLIAVLRPEPPPPNPFDAFGPVDTEESPLF